MIKTMKTLKKFNLKNKRVLVRCDFNVPLSSEGLILDDFRIRETVPTIKYLIKEKAKVILMSHLGRPDGKIMKRFSLLKVQKRLSRYLKKSVLKTNDCLGREVEKKVYNLKPGQVLLLENLRFHKEEEKNDTGFAKVLAKLGEIYINDAFGASHRAHASIVGVPKCLPSGAGFLLEKEINSLSKIIKNPKKPLVSVIGGAKVETKVKFINRISKISNFVLIGGLIKKEIKKKKVKLDYPKKVVGQAEPFKGVFRYDIGPGTVKIFKDKIKKAKTILFNGTLGKIEEKRFSKGTEEVLKAIAKSGAFSVVGGGEAVELINKLGLSSKFGHISTGGGAMLAFLSGEKLPGIEALKSAKRISIEALK